MPVFVQLLLLIVARRIHLCGVGVGGGGWEVGNLLRSWGIMILDLDLDPKFYQVSKIRSKITKKIKTKTKYERKIRTILIG